MKDKIPQMAKEMTELGEETKASLKEIQAQAPDSDELKKVYETIYSILDRFDRRINYIWSEIYAHYKGHLPSVPSVEQMKKAVKALGLSEEYEVQSKVIFANGPRGEANASLEYKKA